MPQTLSTAPLSTAHRVQFRNIALLTDLESGSDAALRYAGTLARWYGAKLLVAHSNASDNYVYVPATAVAMWPPLAPLPNMDAEKKALDMIARLGMQDVVAHVLTTESGMDGLLKELEDLQPDLMVLATHARTGLRKWLAGSTTEEVFRRCHWPVLVLSPQVIAAGPNTVAIQHVLYATDLSGVSADALAYAAGIARDHDAELVNVFVEPDKTRDFTFDRVLALQRMEDWLQQHTLSHEALHTSAEHLVRCGEPAEEILAAAKAWNADLIVLGARGLGAMSGLASHFVGGTAYQVACSAHCPTLIVPQQS